MICTTSIRSSGSVPMLPLDSGIGSGAKMEFEPRTRLSRSRASRSNSDSAARFVKPRDLGVFRFSAMS
jgi:hypothetical protein